ncbi:MAG TPA: hypothetical protein V6C81_31140 [Planktothrix sp.]|jgi:hypothetical protein
MVGPFESLGTTAAAIAGLESSANQSNGQDSGAFGGLFHENHLLQSGLSAIGWGHKTQQQGGADANTAQARDTRPVQQNYPPADSTIHLHYGDANIDRVLETASNYDTIQIDLPQGVQLKNWTDQNGYYFWIKNADGSTDGKKHYYPPFAKQICINGQLFDLEAQRLKCNEDLANWGSNRQYFESIPKHGADNPYQAAAFAARLSGIDGGILAAEEKSLSDAVQSSGNPYFKLYLADVYTAQAMQPLIAQFQETGHIKLDNPQTRQRLQMATNVLNAVVGDAKNGLQRINKNPPGNASLPLDPYEIYVDGRNGMYGFWGGAYDQAMARAASLTALQNLIQTSALPSVLAHTDLLPPR